MQRRRSERIAVHLNATFILAGNIYQGFITNVSVDGIGISITSVVEIKTEFAPIKILELQFEIPSGDSIHLQAELVWFSRTGENSTQLNLGLKLIAPPPQFKDFAKALYAERLNSTAREQLIAEVIASRQKISELESHLHESRQAQADVALVKDEENYRALVEASDNSIYIVDRDGTYLFMNQKHIARLSLSDRQYVGHTYADFHTQSETDEFIRKINDVFTAGAPLYYEHQSKTDGRYYLLTMSPIRESEGEIRAVTVISKDITDRKFAEELLQSSTQELERQVRQRTADLQALNEDLSREITERSQTEHALTRAAENWRITFDSAKDLILMIDKDLTIIKVNKATTHFLGKPYHEILSRRFFDLFADIEAPQGRHPLEKVMLSKKHEEAEIYLKTRDKWLWASVDPIADDSGEVTGAVHIMRDITEQKSLQLQLLHSQKMESVGRLAGGIAHDFNNLLSSIIGYTELILLKLPPDSPFKDYLTTVKEAGDKAALLTQRLLAFSRKQLLQMQVINVNTIIENMAKIIARLIREDILIELHSEPSIHFVMADPVQIEQVLMNLMLNARDAMPNGGKLIIETRDVLVDSDFIVRHENVQPGQYVLLAVSDTGIGMSKKIQDNLFEPFFTTKPSGEGTGLGLATVYGVIKQHNGHIYVYSEVGKGTTFKIYLPACNAEQKETSEKKHTVLPGGNETVLVVDDDPLIRKLITDILLPLGYRLLFASDGSEAITVASKSKEPIEALITDVIMPNMSGREFADIFHKNYPDAKVMFISGYTDETIGKQGIMDSHNILIQKPFSPSILANKLRAILDNSV